MNEQSGRLTKPDTKPADSKESTPASTLTQSWVRPSGEVDLVDVGILLWRWRWLMLAVFLVFIALTVITTVFKRPAYQYTTTLQLGTTISRTSGNVLPMMSAQSVAQTMQSTYIPGALNQYATDNHMQLASVQVPPITAVGDPNSYEVVLSCRTETSLEPACIAVEQIAAQNFIKDNSRFATIAEHQLASLQAQAGVLRSQMDKLDAAAVLYQQRSKALQQQIDRLQKTKVDAAGNPTSGSNTLLNVQLLHAIDSLSTMQQGFVVGILQQRAQLSQQLSDNLDAQQLQQQTISQGYMRILNPGLRSVQPVGMSRRSLLGIGILLSIVLGLIAAFAAGYMQQVHKRLAAETRN